MSKKKSDNGNEFRLRPSRPQARQRDASAWSIALTSILRYARTSRRNLKRAAQVARRRRASQRCAVRVMYSQNATPGQWRAHARYIVRESAAGTLRIESSAPDDADRNAQQILDGWQRANDPRLWKLIVSPEFGDRVDLDDLTRNLMSRMERDLATKLEWVAVPQFNTEHPHVHIALRGVRDDGTPLKMDRDYVRHGIRAHAEQLCTLQLGFRSTLDAIEAERHEISARRYTSLDRQINRAAAADTGIGDTTHFILELNLQTGLRADRNQHLAARLGTLRSMGLAEVIAPNRWRVRRDFGTVLKAMQIAGDRQKTLAAHGALLSDPRLEVSVLDRRKLTAVEGRVLGHGEEESGSAAGRHYMLLEGTDARVHLIYHTPEMEEARSRGRLKPNSFVRLQKQFENGQPVLEITDHGAAESILKNRPHLVGRAQQLIRAGAVLVDEGWGGWLGQYYAALRRAEEELHSKEAQGVRRAAINERGRDVDALSR